jgi:hypothetical protein
MAGITISLDQLRGLIGLRVRYQACDCRIIEVLEDGPSLVLQAESDCIIQHNQHGDAHRQVPRTIEIPVLTPDREELSHALLSLDLLDPFD